MLLPLFDSLKRLVHHISMGALLSLFTVDPSDLVRLGDNLNGRSGGTKDRGSTIVIGDGNVQTEQHVFVLAGQNLHSNLQRRLVRSLIGEMNFVFAGLGGHQLHLLSFSRIIAIVVDPNRNGTLAQVDVVAVRGGKVLRDTKDNIEGSVLHNNMNITRDTGFGSKEEFGKRVLLGNEKRGGGRLHIPKQQQNEMGKVKN